MKQAINRQALNAEILKSRLLVRVIRILIIYLALLAQGTVSVANELRDYTQESSGLFAQVIPLNAIWALDMPGTRPMDRTIRGDPPVYESPEGLLVDEIRSSLKYDPRKYPLGSECFIVLGTGMQALKEAHAVFIKGQPRQTSARKGEKISLVFFSYQFGAYVHISEVHQKANNIEIIYRFVPHETKDVTAHVALIPIDHLNVGSSQVVTRIDVAASKRNWSQWSKRIVCRSFTFDVEGQ